MGKLSTATILLLFSLHCSVFGQKDRPKDWARSVNNCTKQNTGISVFSEIYSVKVKSAKLIPDALALTVKQKKHYSALYGTFVPAAFKAQRKLEVVTADGQTMYFPIEDQSAKEVSRIMVADESWSKTTVAQSVRISGCVSNFKSLTQFAVTNGKSPSVQIQKKAHRDNLHYWWADVPLTVGMNTIKLTTERYDDSMNAEYKIERVK